MKILFVRWFTCAKQHFGIVVGVDDITEKKKAYIGRCQPNGTEDSDATHILQYGAKFLPEDAKILNDYLNDEK